MAECVYEMVVPTSAVRDPSADIRTTIYDNDDKLYHFCGYHGWRTACPVDPKLKILCGRYRPRSTVNRMPEETKGTVDPKTERKGP